MDTTRKLFKTIWEASSRQLLRIIQKLDLNSAQRPLSKCLLTKTKAIAWKYAVESGQVTEKEDKIASWILHVMRRNLNGSYSLDVQLPLIAWNLLLITVNICFL